MLRTAQCHAEGGPWQAISREGHERGRGQGRGVKHAAREPGRAPPCCTTGMAVVYVLCRWTGKLNLQPHVVALVVEWRVKTKPGAAWLRLGGIQPARTHTGPGSDQTMPYFCVVPLACSFIALSCRHVVCSFDLCRVSPPPSPPTCWAGLSHGPGLRAPFISQGEY
ncbi:hypothetical protein B0T24DRAFT_157516 [Lasiosphaeria ovina]|uniref:Uncharacterized protein n=1 Tax=Lasiosphaeria ovina TaxID=92902 RepID=A0AAE0KNF3_9PEZI|nr:hypothetical protein B0T24DRAFT_157516 [Lasiosphaeria ovina]